MIYAVWLPFLLPLIAVPAARRIAEALAPRPAAWLLTATTVALALCSTAALALLVVAGALLLPPVAAIGDLIKPLAGGNVLLTGLAAGAAAALLCFGATVLVRTVRRQTAELCEARRLMGRPKAGDLSVLRDGRPDAYALPGRPGRIVVTTGMLQALEPVEREALFAHERAHLSGRHHLFLACAELAALCHPTLRSLRPSIGYALERWADESAADAVGDRSVAARAIGRAALAARSAPSPRPSAALAAAAGPVPRRVAALLDRRPAAARSRGRTVRGFAVVLLACLALSAGAAVEAGTDLHRSVETAQGESDN
ncbi:M56 family metallopeptidase [Streptomyces beijiangensis]|uniref:M56 family metallopeptidase n=1 Tax=Streptomyces beijiangensis TaxID=163361 RepID=A0A939FDJ2_9ACTN|nr:M56 family metallopeptidase [Streptomyces beijiangensis]MBO0516344.1 M56 family metallopeptidase [Streptomyces beijiangensis]